MSRAIRAQSGTGFAIIGGMDDVQRITEQDCDGISTSLSTRRRPAQARTHIIRAANDIDDLQRSIQLAFAVPETNVASAIGYLIGEGSAEGNFSDDVASMFEPLATPQGCALCADLLKIRLEWRAEKFRKTRDVASFAKALLKRTSSES